MSTILSLAVSQIIQQNPVLKQPDSVRRKYYQELQRYVRISRYHKKQYVEAQLALYREVLLRDLPLEGETGDLGDCGRLLPLDYLQVIGYDQRCMEGAGTRRVWEAMQSDPALPDAVMAVLRAEREQAPGGEKFRDFRKYLSAARQNLRHIGKKPAYVLVTSTMSAGKSTFLNAIAGKKLNRSMNMACTAKIHYIIGKPFDLESTDDAALQQLAQKLLRACGLAAIEQEIHQMINQSNRRNGKRNILRSGIIPIGSRHA